MHRSSSLSSLSIVARRVVIGAAAILILVALVTSGCSSNSASSASSSSAQTGSDMPTLDLVHTDDPFADFAANSATSVLLSDDELENTCFSPISLYLALALCEDGTQGDAQSQLLDLLGVDNDQELLDLCKRTIESLENTYDPYKLKIANSVWANKGYSFKDGYLARVKDALDAEAYDVEFGTVSADDQISEWISDNTEGLLNPAIQTSSFMVAALIDTIYFKDNWSDAFSESATTQAAFHAEGGDKEVPFMHTTREFSFYADEEGYTAAQLEFQGGGYMTFYLPDEGKTPLELIETPQTTRELLDTPFATKKVNWSVPKFTIDSSFRKLVDNLVSLGITDIFDPSNPDTFAPMLEVNGADVGSAYISDVIQETHMALDENGVEAAAYTAMMMKALAMEPENEEEPVDFTLDRPFLYTISSPDGVVLFIGCVQLPE